ncbi:MAG: ABC transporter ATP-binding protein/permease [Spirochaetaceae bacterium]|jgi:ATP-binding cassette subfamily B protein|nr:ABC transporter ATP-binding protein/permease [Spirochaetaceae bacterium]
MRKTSPLVFKTLLPYLYRYRFQYLGGFLCLLIIDAAQMSIPQLMRRAIDLISQGDFQWAQVGLLALAMTGIMALISLGRFLWRYFIHGSSRRIEAEMRNRLFEHLLTLSYDFYQENKIGDLMARATNDLAQIRMAIGWGLVALVDGTVMVTAILIIIFVQDAHTALFAVLPLPPITALILLFGRVIGKRFRRANEAYSAMSDTVQETFAGIRVVKSFVKEWWFIKKFADTNDDYQAANMELVKLYGVFFPFISFLSGLTSVILILAGGIRVIEGLMSPGDLVALFSYFQMLIWPLMGAGFMVNMIQRGAASLERINEVMKRTPSIASPASPVRPQPSVPVPLVEIRNLSFSYPGGREVLDDVSLTIPAGAVVGILGRTGSGKSTVIKTLTRMVDPPPGTVLIKGVSVGDWDLGELRALFGVTPQDSYLFSNSIKHNIRYGIASPGEGAAGNRTPSPQPADDLKEEELLFQAAGISAIDQDLGSFAAGWDTLIGERGLTLSGGQKQRVAISRAVIGSPEILILDDSLSAVDAETEKRILTSLLAERRGKTTIIISHRVSTLRNADVVVVLDKGRISESGSPQELAARGGFYAKMAALQQLEQAEGGGVRV